MATRKLPKGATTKRPSSRGYASNRAVIENLVAPEKVAANYPSTMSGNRDVQRQAFAEGKTGVSETYKLDAKGNKIPVSEEEFKKAAQKFVNAERKIPKGTSLNQVKAAKLAGKEKAISDIAKVASKGLDNLSAAERKMAREGVAPARAPATPPTPKPAAPVKATKAPKKAAAAKVSAPKTTVAAPKMTRAERSAANKAKHAGVRAAEEKKWAEQKAAKKAGAAKAPAKVKATTTKPAAPAKTVATPAAKKPVAAKPVKVAPTRKAKPQTAKPEAAKAAPASSAAAPATAAPKAGILSKLKGITKNVFSLKAAGAEIGGNFAADAIRGDGKSSARNIVATVVDDATTGYAVGRQYGALAGAAVGLVRGASAEGKRTGKAPLALPTTPSQGGTFGGKQPAMGGSVGPRTRGGARGVSRTSGASTAAAARPATTAKQGVSGFGAAFKQARQARLSGKAGDTFEYAGKTYTSYQKGEQPRVAAPKAAAPEMPKSAARASWNASKATDMGTIEISKPAQNNQMQQSISAMQLEEQFKKRKGPR